MSSIERYNIKPTTSRGEQITHHGNRRQHVQHYLERLLLVALKAGWRHYRSHVRPRRYELEGRRHNQTRRDENHLDV